MNISIEEIQEIMAVDFPVDTERVLREKLLEKGVGFIQELALRVPGYAVNTLAIKLVDFDPELWPSLYRKQYFYSAEDSNYWTEPSTEKFLKPTSMISYYKALNEKVVDRDFLIKTYKDCTTKYNIAAQGKPASDALTLMYEQRFKELSNARDFVVQD